MGDTECIQLGDAERIQLEYTECIQLGDTECIKSGGTERIKLWYRVSWKVLIYLSVSQNICRWGFTSIDGEQLNGQWEHLVPFLKIREGKTKVRLDKSSE